MKSKIIFKPLSIRLIQDYSEKEWLHDRCIKKWEIRCDETLMAEIISRKIKGVKSYYFVLMALSTFTHDRKYVHHYKPAKLPKPYKQLGIKKFDEAKEEAVKAIYLNLYKLLQ